MNLKPNVGRGRHEQCMDGSISCWSNFQNDSFKTPMGGDKSEIGVWPLDEHNAKLLDNVAPKAWKSPEAKMGTQMYFDLVAIGGGAGGLVSSKQSARRGARSAMIEKHMAGGDCLNVGCVPSKALLRCARVVKEMRNNKTFGVTGPIRRSKFFSDQNVENCNAQNIQNRYQEYVESYINVDFPAIMARMRKLRARISPADAYTASVGLGVSVFNGAGRFTSRNTIEVELNNGGSRSLRFGKAVIATGGSASVPPIPGLADVPYHTNASLYNLTACPPRFLIIGAGPIGLEMAQAFSLFGSFVRVVDIADKIMPREDPEASAIVQKSLEEDGVEFILNAKSQRLEVVQNKAGWTAKNPCFTEDWPDIKIKIMNADRSITEIEVDAVLVATGRKPNVEGLGLEQAGVRYNKRDGIQVDDRLFTSNPNILAVGDVCTKYKFTHVAGTMAEMAVENALFKGNKRMSDLVIPRCTFTEPEVAHTGADAADLDLKGVEYDVYSSDLKHNDRAILDGSDNGFFKVYCRKGTDEILGGTIVAEGAGEMIGQLTLACQFKIPLGSAGLGSMIQVYPTVAGGIGGAAFGCKMKRWSKVKVDESDSSRRKLLVVYPKNVSGTWKLSIIFGTIGTVVVILISYILRIK